MSYNPINPAALVKSSIRQNREACEQCGTFDLYWAKDTANGDKWVLIDKTYSTTAARRGDRIPTVYAHEHQPVKGGKTSTPAATTVEPTTVEPVEPVTVDPASILGDPAQNLDPAQALNILRDFLGAGVDPQQLASMVEGIVNEGLAAHTASFDAVIADKVAEVAYPTKTVVINAAAVEPVEPVTFEGHKDLARVIAYLGDGHLYLVGPAGTGKSRLAEDATTATGRTFGSISLTMQTPVSALAGYMDAHGNYVRTAFRDCVEFGGGFLGDEIDHGHPNTVAFANAATSNRIVGFPDGMVTVHPDFRFIAAANTYGKGKTLTYTGATKLDAATLNRFGQMFIDYDEGLENSIVLATGLDSTAAAKVLRFVRAVRANAVKRPEFEFVASPRNAVRIAKALVRGEAWDEAVEVHLLAGLSEDKRAALVG